MGSLNLSCPNLVLITLKSVQISYKCMPNMKQIISNHNKTILNKDNNTESKTNNCNCRIKEACPVVSEWVVIYNYFLATSLVQSGSAMAVVDEF